MADLTRDHQTEIEEGAGGGAGARWVLVAVLALVCLMVRLQSLMAFPVFGDEAIYLRWAQLIREGHPWVSLVDPKPPLHFWLIAAVFGWPRDPLTAARMISVACAVLTLPVLAGVCDEVALLVRGEGPSGRILGLLAGLLLIFCPFIAFYQRLATADALFILEMTAAVWLAMHWARSFLNRSGAWKSAIGLGLVMGTAMMTRQGLSYTLWGMPIVAIALQRGSSGRLSPKYAWQSLAQLATAALIAAAIWTPYLTADFDRFAIERGGPIGELKTRILYQDQFTNASGGRLGAAFRNAQAVFIPTWKDGQPENGWFFFYMTWPIYAASVAGLLLLAARRQWKVLFLLFAWFVLMVGVPILLGSVLRSRYVVAGVVPLLIAAAYFLAELLGLLLSLRPSWLAWTTTLLLLAALIVMPLRELGRQQRNWWQQTLTQEDRYQYITGWTAGSATMQAIHFIKDFSATGGGNTVVVITNDGWGLPADAAWVYLSDIPNVSVYYTSHSGDSPILTPAPNGNGNTFLLRKNKWLYTPPEPVTIPHTPGNAAAAPVILYLTNDPVYTREHGPMPAETFLRQFNPNLVRAETFYGIDGKSDRVVLFELK